MRPPEHPRYDFDPNDRYKLVLQTGKRKPPFAIIGVCGPWEEDLLRYLEGDWLTGEAKRVAQQIKEKNAASD